MPHHLISDTHECNNEIHTIFFFIWVVSISSDSHLSPQVLQIACGTKEWLWHLTNDYTISLLCTIVVYNFVLIPYNLCPISVTAYEIISLKFQITGFVKHVNPKTVQLHHVKWNRILACKFPHGSNLLEQDQQGKWSSFTRLKSSNFLAVIFAYS